MNFIGTYVWVNFFGIIYKILLNIYWVSDIYSLISDYTCPISFKEQRVSYNIIIIPLSYSII